MKNRIKELVSRLNEYRDAYYNKNESLVSDREYDELLDELEMLEQKTGIVYANSPSQSVGYEVISGLKKVKHGHPLLSLAKTTDIKEFEGYFAGKDMILMAKMDGLTASLTYRDGKLALAESRGNGEIGEDITHNVKTFCNLPLEIPYNGELVVDGECIIDYGTFDEINKRENTEYKNPRNLASGTVRQLDSSVCAKRNVRFIAWKMHNGMESFETSLNLLSSLGFEIVPFLFLSKHYRYDIRDCVTAIRSHCENIGYPIDGLVGTFDNAEYGESLGSTGHHPKHSLAFKFYQEDNITVLRDIEWGVSRTGMVNPVAVFDPVEIDGTTVERASLSNVSIIKNLQLGIGDQLSVIKSNQIIPMIRENMTRSGTYLFPKTCPCCGHSLELRNDNGSEMLYCVNKNCPDIILDKLAYFASREGLNIAGLSRERIKTLMNAGIVSDFMSILNIKERYEELRTLDGFGVKSANSIVAAVEESKHCKFANVLVAIGIPGVGKSTAKDLVRECVKFKYGNILRSFCYTAKNQHDWSSIPGFGVVMSNAINKYVSENMTDILALQSFLDIEEDRRENEGAFKNIFDGKNFCITGKLVQYANRDSLVEAIENHGGKVVSGVSTKTNYLITNDKDSGSSKNEKAKKFGTEIISELEFMEMIK